MEAKLIHTQTGRVVRAKAPIKHENGECWRYEHHEGSSERVTEHTLIHCSRLTKAGRVHRTFHPRVFGCVLTVDATLYVDKAKVTKFLTFWAVQLTLLTVGGFIAWYIGHQMGA